MQNFEFGEKVNVRFCDGSYGPYYYMGEHIVSDGSPAAKLNSTPSGNKVWDEGEYAWTYLGDISKIKTNEQQKEQPMKISMDKQYRTRDGRSVRVLCIDMKSEKYPVVAILKRKDGSEVSVEFTENGLEFAGEKGRNDLIEYNPAMNLKMDQPLWVRDSTDYDWAKRHFSYVDKHGRVHCWAGGCTSHTSDEKPEGTIRWPYWSATKPE